uniref:Uncharacterized protein n=1 Tax=Siphoviridae sp. ctDXu9 TaxID=2825387 RepID=A0A8S5VCY1_9CAUD|nr:MAG TPA: hypothetical protein [Siphoviridae sp. ctDXu9]DAJ86175.1 MAG TPA: hypothetical protein [Caudoviricetes sp.]
MQARHRRSRNTTLVVWGETHAIKVLKVKFQ